jgi:hypothetical protein
MPGPGTKVVMFAGIPYFVGGTKALFVPWGTATQHPPPVYNQNITAQIALTPVGGGGNIPAPTPGVNFYVIYGISDISGMPQYLGAMDLSLASTLIFTWVNQIQFFFALTYAAEYWDGSGKRVEVIGPTYNGNSTPNVAALNPMLASVPTFTFTPAPYQLPNSQIVP